MHEKLDAIKIRNAVKNNLFKFTNLAMLTLENLKFTSSGHGQFICEILQDIQKQKLKNVIINIPPGHSKTFTVANGLIPFILGHDPSCRIIYVSSKQELALKKTEQIKKFIMSEPYKLLFPHIELDKKGDGRMTLKGCRGSVDAKGLLGSITGENADLIVLDDPIDASSTRHEIEVAKSTIATSILNRLRAKPGGNNYGFILINQRTSENDVTEFFLKNYNIQYHIVMPFTEEEDKIYHHNNVIFKREAGTPLNPNHITKEDVINSVGDYERSDTARRIFETQYQQNPKPAQGQLMKLSHFTYYSQEALNNTKFKKLFLTIDTANKTKTHNDYSVICCWGEVGSKLCLLDMLRGKWEFAELSNAFYNFYKKWQEGVGGIGVGVTKIIIEDASAGTQLIQSFENLFKNSYLIKSINRKNDKFTRYTLVARYIETGHICLPSADVVIDGVLNTKKDITDIFLDECIFFTPNGSHKHDDIVDNLIDAATETFLTKDNWLSSVMKKY